VLGVPHAYFHGIAEPETEAHLGTISASLEQAGAKIVEVRLPGTAPEIAELAQPVMRYEAARAHATMFAANRDAYRPNIKSLIEAGLATSDAKYEQAREQVAALRDAIGGLLRDVDALLLPTSPGPAPAGLTSTGPGIFCGPASFTGLPSIALPSGLAADGLPYSIQLIGPALGEAKLLNAAAWVEGVLGFRARPDLPA
jgi:amidase